MNKKVRDKDYWFIGKVQVSLAGVPKTLIYDEDRKWVTELDRSFGERILVGRAKGYFKMCHKKDGTLYIHKEVSAKDW